MVYDNNTNTPGGADTRAFNEAKKVFDSFNLPNFMPGGEPTLKVNHPGFGGKSVYVGTYAQFKQPFSIPNMFGGSAPLNMTSESFLGREPTRATCVDRICRSMGESGGTCGKNTTFYDNGC